MQRLSAADFERATKERKLPPVFSKTTAPNYMDFVIVGYAVGEADNKIYPCVRNVLARGQSPIIAFPLKGKMAFPKMANLLSAEEAKAGNVDFGLYRHYKGGMYYVQGTCVVADGDSRPAVLYSAIDSGLPFMWLRSLEDWNTKVPVGCEEVERFSKI